MKLSHNGTVTYYNDLELQDMDTDDLKRHMEEVEAYRKKVQARLDFLERFGEEY